MDLSLEAAVFNFDYDGEDFTIPLGAHILSGCLWRCPNPQYVVVFVHGLGGFLSSYHDVGDIIVGSGGIFMGCDHIGHGRSPGPRVSSTIDEILSETELVVRKAGELFPGLPIFLYGYSMGGLAVIDFVLRKRDFSVSNLRGVIAGSPWISNSLVKSISLVESVAIWIGSKIAPLVLLPSGTDTWPSDLRLDYIASLISCPYHSKQITPRLLDSALTTMTRVRKSYREWPKELPVLFMQGDSDALVDPKTNQAWFDVLKEAAGEKVVEIRWYEGGNHNLLKGCVTRPLGLQHILDFINRLK
jgi:acylglycerol lipase